MGNRLAAIFYGILIGLMPMINLVVATVMAYNRKYKKRLLLLVSLLITAGAGMVANSDSETYGETTPMASELALKVNLVIANTSPAATVNTSQLDSVVKTTWPQIARNHAKNKKLKKMLQHAVDGDFSSESHNKLATYLNSLHLLAAQKDSTVQTEVLRLTESFVSHYMFSERENHWWLGFVVMATYIIGLYHCIVLFRDRATGDNTNSTSGNQQQQFSQPGTASNRRTGNPPPAGRRPMPGDDLSLFDPRNQDSTTESMAGEDVLDRLQNDSDNNINAAPAGDVIYINLLTEAQLAGIPGISSIQAKMIIQQRNSDGPFTDRYDFARRSRLSDMVIDRIENQLNYSVSGNNNRSNSGGRVLDI